MIKITDDEWEEKYGVVINHNTGDDKFDPHDDWDTVSTYDNKHVWTTVDTGEGYITIPGVHFVNRLYYHVTEEPWEHKNIEVVFD